MQTVWFCLPRIRPIWRDWGWRKSAEVEGRGEVRGFPLPTFRRGTSYIRPYYGEKSTNGLYTERIWAAIYKVFNNPCKKANVTYKSTYRVKSKGQTYLFEVWTYVLWEVLVKALNVESQTISFLFLRNVFKLRSLRIKHQSIFHNITY